MKTDVIAMRHALLTISEGIAVFTHQRPAVRNALSLELRADYSEMLDRVEADRSVRALVLTGSGGSFCAGGDLKSIQTLLTSDDASARSSAVMRRRLQDTHKWLRRLRDLEMPVIAAVDGPAVGAGFSIALAADFVIASERAFFCMSFAEIGLVPDMGALHALPRVVGMARARDLMFTGRRLPSAEALHWGMVHAIHPSGQLVEEAMQLARRFRALPVEAIALMKRSLNRTFETPYEALLDSEAQAQAIASSMPDYARAVAEFLAASSRSSRPEHRDNPEA